MSESQESDPKAEGQRSILKTPFPWHIGLHDTHCHPLEYPDSLSPSVLATINTQTFAVLATRLEDQDILDHIASKHRPDGKKARVIPGFGWHPWFSYLLYDDLEESDKEGEDFSEDQIIQHFKTVLAPPAEPDFSKNLPKPTRLSSALAALRKHLAEHPLALVGEVGIDKAFRIPEPWPGGIAPASVPHPEIWGCCSNDLVVEQPEEQDDYKHETEKSHCQKGPRTPGGRMRRQLSRHRVSMEHQKKILLLQMGVAGEYQRAVSLHGVQAHGALFDLLKSLWANDLSIKKPTKSKRNTKPKDTEAASSTAKDTLPSHEEAMDKKPAPKYPPRICLHSFSGTKDTLAQYFPTKSSSSRIPIEFYASFSTPNNFRTSLSTFLSSGTTLAGDSSLILTDEMDTASKRALECIKFIPDDRILVESDMHSAGVDSDGFLEDVTRRICLVKGWNLEEGVKRLAANWRKFAFGDEEVEG
jgi:Tat protein secretion system quality control protein TatD with DNase activity